MEENKAKKVQEPVIKMEDVLESSGGYGPFQIALTFAAIYPQLAGAMIILSPVFTSTNKAPMYCTNQTDFYESFPCGVNCTEPDEDSVVSSIVQEWNLICSRSWLVETITSCQMAGMMTGAVLSSIIADSFGRNRGFFFVTTAMGVFGILPSLAAHPVIYAISRFLAGFGVGGSFVVCYVHLMEFLTPKWRTICGCVSLMPEGEMLLALLAYLISSWRLLTIATAAPVFVLVLFYPFIQESPRWLLTRGRTKEAYEVLRRISKWNRRPAPQVAVVEALQATILSQEADIVKGMDGVKQIWQNADLRLQLAILTWANAACTTVYYGVAFSTKSMSGSPYLNMLYMGILDLLVLPAVLLFNDRIGRKKTFNLYIGLATLCLLSALLLNIWRDLIPLAPTLITIVALIGRFGIGSASGALRCIILESFPTTLRSSCLGFTVFASYLGAITAPQIVFLSHVSAALPYVIYCSLTITSAVFSLFLYEMTGAPLQDTLTTSKSRI